MSLPTKESEPLESETSEWTSACDETEEKEENNISQKEQSRQNEQRQSEDGEQQNSSPQQQADYHKESDYPSFTSHPKFRDRAKTARQESGSLREYSRRRFQTVVAALKYESFNHQTFPRSCKTIGGERGNENSYRDKYPSNGPTKDGSILYNIGKLPLYNSARASSDIPSRRFDHLRGSSAQYPEIRRTLEESNRHFRVMSSPPHPHSYYYRHYYPAPTSSTFPPPGSRASSTFPRGRSHSGAYVMLVPVTSSVIGDVTMRSAASAAGVAPAWEDGQILKTSSLKSNSAKKMTVSWKIPKEGGRGERTEQGCLEDDSKDPHRGPQSPSTQRAGAVPQVNLTQHHASEDEHAPHASSDNPTTATSPSTPPSSPDSPRKSQTKSSAALLTVPGSSSKRQTSAKGSKKKANSPSSPSSPRPSSARSDTSSVLSGISGRSSSRPHCWVDDVTISSDSDDHHDDDVDEDSLTERLEALGGQSETVTRSGVKGHDLKKQGMSPGRQNQQVLNSVTAEKKKMANLSLQRLNNPNNKPIKRVSSASKGHAKLASGSKALEAKRGTLGQRGRGGCREGVEVGVRLPRFLCPSSESKSRQAALREWLAKTSFSAACRTVPLM